LFDYAGSSVQIIYCRLRKSSVIVIRESVRHVEESIVANINYVSLMQIQVKTLGNLIQGTRFCD
jgi:hypothetical protein